jgi:hypothetical protein
MSFDFDFDAAVSAPFRMQPGLRRLEPGAPQLTPLAPGSRHQREKLAVLSAFAGQALLTRAGFDPAPALDVLFREAAREHPLVWTWDGRGACAPQLGVRVQDARVEQLHPGVFGLGDELPRCLASLAAEWRLPALFSLSFAEDLAIVDASDASVPWLSVALPSHWAPEDKVGLHFARIHGPVADGELLRRAGAALTRLVSEPQRWERFVWNVTDQPRLHAHPRRVDAVRWSLGSDDADPSGLPRAWFRSERQTFIPVPGLAQSVFTIRVDVRPLADVIDGPDRAGRLAAAVESMSAAVLEYRGLTPVRDRLLQWLAGR